MNVFVAGVSSETQYVKSMIAFRELRIGSRDETVAHSGATGWVARKTVCSEFLRRKEFDAIMLLDLDMTYPSDTLARLREHDLDMVTGHYYRRQMDPMMSIAEVGEDWPYTPMVNVPHSGLHEVAVAGFGCVLIKRHVIEAVAEALPPLLHPFDNGPLEWLTGTSLGLGPDKRFYALARKAGYKLMMDAEVKCKHGVTAWLDDDLYEKLRNKNSQARLFTGYWLEYIGRYGVEEKTIKLRLQALSLEREVLLEKFREEDDPDKQQALTVALNDYDSRMSECRDWITGVQATVEWPEAPKDALEEYEKARTSTVNEEYASHARKNVTRTASLDWMEALDGRE